MPTVEKGSPDLLGQRLRRLEEIATQLSRLYVELAETKTKEREAKAQIYLNLPANMSHGERQARASHETVDMDSEVVKLVADIDSLREERDFLRLLVETVE